MSDVEQAKSQNDAPSAEIPRVRNEPPGQHPHGNDTANSRGNEHRPREPHEKRIREWLIVLFTGTIVVGTLYYASIAKRQADLMSQQRDLMIQQTKVAQTQTNLSERSVNLAVNSAAEQSNVTARTLELTGKSVNATEKATSAAVTQASASMNQAIAAKRGANIAEESFKAERRPSLGVSAATMKEFSAEKPTEVEILFQNFGRSPAKNTSITTTTWWSSEICAEPPRPEFILPGQLATRTIIPSNVTRTSHGYTSVPLPQPLFILIQDDPPKAWVYVFSRAEYADDHGSRYFVEFYVRYNVKLKVFEDCPTHNDAN